MPPHSKWRHSAQTEGGIGKAVLRHLEGGVFRVDGLARRRVICHAEGNALIIHPRLQRERNARRLQTEDRLVECGSDRFHSAEKRQLHCLFVGGDLPQGDALMIIYAADAVTERRRVIHSLTLVGHAIGRFPAVAGKRKRNLPVGGIHRLSVFLHKNCLLKKATLCLYHSKSTRCFQETAEKNLRFFLPRPLIF